MTFRHFILLGGLCAASLVAEPPMHASADPMVTASDGMVVSAQHLATDAGVSILKAGGNAIDAAVAVGYALAVVYPVAGNLGGGGFMTIRMADGRATFLDFREKAPRGATPAMFQDGAGHVTPGLSTDSWLAVGVPSTEAGLDAALRRYGHLSRHDVLAPAIALARDGFELDAGDAAVFAADTAELARDPRARAIFTHDGQPLRAGDRLVQPQLAHSLESIDAMGPDSFAHGPIGLAISAASQAGHGLITIEDFAAYRVRELEPVRCTYRGYDVISAPPPSSGGTIVCEILNILEGYDLRALPFHSAQEVHLLVEAMRRAYRDRNEALGDPDFIANPVARLIDKTYAATLRTGIAPQDATPSATLPGAPARVEGAQTTHFSVVDKKGNAVSVTYTLNGAFGSHRVAGDTGILMNNEMDDFTAKVGVPNMFGLVQGEANAVAPGKTPLSSMSPTILARGNQLFLVTGSPGGPRIITTVVETIVNVVDHDMPLDQAIDVPRLHHQYLPDVVDIEPGALTEEVKRTLQSRGYVLRERPPWGHAESVMTKAGAESSAPSGEAARAFMGANDRRAASGSASGP